MDPSVIVAMGLVFGMMLKIKRIYIFCHIADLSIAQLLLRSPMAISSCVSDAFKIKKSIVDAKILLANEQTLIMRQMQESPNFKIEYANQIVSGLAGAASVLSEQR